MKKRNKYFEREKEYLKLQKSLRKNWEAQRALGYVELEKPIHHGYTTFLVLRKDVSNREDAWVFQHILDLSGETKWWRKDYKKHPPKKFYYGNSDPIIHGISERTYDSLPPQVKKWFAEDTIVRNIRWYYCTVPRFFFEVKVEKNFKTHVKVMDEVLLQEKAEIEAELEKKIYDSFSRVECGAPKSYVRFYNVSFRRENKRITKYNFNHLDEDDHLEYSLPGRRSAAWDWW